MASVLRVGVVGLGVASTQILPFIEKLPFVKVTAAADVRKDAVEGFKSRYQAEGFHSIEDLCRSPNVDVVYICTPNHLHAEHVCLAAENRKHIIVEKPMALSMEECEAMNQAVERHGVKLLCGHTHSFDPPIQKMGEIVQSGELGRLMMIHAWDYTDFMYRPRMPHELDTKRGGGAVFIQGPHHVDIVRQIAGRELRNVRGMTGRWDESRPTEGSYVAYLEFVDGTPATIVYNGYGHFDTAELHYWVGEGGEDRDPETNFKVRKSLKEVADESGLKEAMRFGGAREGQWLGAHGGGKELRQPFFGIVLVSCEKGDIRQSPEGLFIYGNEGKREIITPQGSNPRKAEITELYEAIVNDRPVFHDGRWGQATLEVCLAIYDSARVRREILLSQQTSSRRGAA